MNYIILWRVIVITLPKSCQLTPWLWALLSPSQVIVSRAAENDGPSQRGMSGKGELWPGQQHGGHQGPPCQAGSAGAERQSPGSGPAGQHWSQALWGALQTFGTPPQALPQKGWVALVREFVCLCVCLCCLCWWCVWWTLNVQCHVFTVYCIQLCFEPCAYPKLPTNFTVPESSWSIYQDITYTGSVREGLIFCCIVPAPVVVC